MGSRQLVRRLVHALLIVPVLMSCEPPADDIPDHPNGVLTEGTCPSCRIESVTEITLGAQHDVLLGDVNFVARTSRGEFLIATSPRLDEILVVDRNGDLVRTVGRSGQGPGEFAMIADLTWDDGSLFALDYRNQRIAQFDSSYQHVQDIPLPLAFGEMVPLSDSRFVTSGVIPTASGTGSPMHIISSAGDLVSSFGGDSIPFNPGGSEERRIAAASDGTIWSAVAGEYRLEHWSSDGELLQQVWKADPWDGRAEQAQPDGPPPPPASVRAIAWDPTGVLWVLSTLPDRRWRDAVQQVMNPGAVRPGYVVTEDMLYLDSRLDAVDPATGSILATLTIDEYAHGFSDSNHLLVSRSAGDGTPQIDVVAVSVVR